LDAFVAQGAIANPVGDLVLFNDGSGNFVIKNPAGLGAEFGNDVELADFDSDGDLDAIVANRGVAGSAAGDRILVNDGFGSFSELLQDAEANKVVKLRRDRRSGTYVVTGFAQTS
jgi:hypothetical protein